MLFYTNFIQIRKNCNTFEAVKYSFYDDGCSVCYNNCNWIYDIIQWLKSIALIILNLLLVFGFYVLDSKCLIECITV